MIDYVQHTTLHAKIETRHLRGIGWGRGKVATSRTFFSSLGRCRAVHRTRLDAQCTAKLVLVVSIFLGYHFVPRVNHPPFMPQKPLLGEHLQHKSMESVFAYILTTDKAIITKLHRNIKQVKYYITVYN